MSELHTSDRASRRRLLQGVVATAGVVSLSSLGGCLEKLYPAKYNTEDLKYPPMQFATQQHRITKEMATYVVSNRSALIEAVKHPEAVVWIPNDATIDMTGAIGVPIAPNVTIASGRLLNDDTGGTIKTDSYDKGIFINPSGGCRITGISLQGPRLDYFDPSSDRESLEDYSALGFKLQGHTAILDNCEVAGWTFAGVALGSKTRATQGWIHHNFMHSNQMNHLGYPMELYNGQHLIEWNYFDRNRHSIAGFGYPTNGYEARFNVVGPHSIQHAFDMHYLGENLDYLGQSSQGMVAGSFVNVHHNVFELTSNSAFSIQGYPQQHARFCNNWCAEQKGGAESGDPEGVVFSLSDADVRVKDNKYGPQAVKPGRQWLQKLRNKMMNRSDTSSSSPPKATLSPMNLNQILNTTNTINSTDNEADDLTKPSTIPASAEQ